MEPDKRRIDGEDMIIPRHAGTLLNKKERFKYVGNDGQIMQSKRLLHKERDDRTVSEDRGKVDGRR
jgi:hypothetical protein